MRREQTSKSSMEDRPMANPEALGSFAEFQQVFMHQDFSHYRDIQSQEQRQQWHFVRCFDDLAFHRHINRRDEV